ARQLVSKVGKGLSDLSSGADKLLDKGIDHYLKFVDTTADTLKQAKNDLIDKLGLDPNHPVVKGIGDMADALIDLNKRMQHFTVGLGEEGVKMITGLTKLGGDLTQFTFDRKYRDEVKDTLEKLSELDGNKVLKKFFTDAKKDFEKDPERAAGRLT